MRITGVSHGRAIWRKNVAVIMAAVVFWISSCGYLPRVDRNSGRTYIPALVTEPPARRALFLQSGTFDEKLEIRKDGIVLVVDGDYTYQPNKTGLAVYFKFKEGDPLWGGIGRGNFGVVTGCGDSSATFHKNEKVSGEYHLNIPLIYHTPGKVPGTSVKGQKVPEPQPWELQKQMEDIKCRTVIIEIKGIFEQPVRIEIQENPERLEKIEEQMRQAHEM